MHGGRFENHIAIPAKAGTAGFTPPFGGNRCT